jgi:pyruvate formate lyase activating enzyme
MGADRIFFSGGEPSIHLPYIERVVSEARKINPEIKVNFDTNGYMTEKDLERILDFSTSVTFDLKAFREELHFALTGASAKPVLRNAEYIGKHAKDKLWEYRIVAIPGINDEDIGLLSEFVAGIDPDLPVCFLAFRPNFVLERHPGATLSLMEKCVRTAEKSGLRNASCAGRVGLPGKAIDIDANIRKKYSLPESALAASYAARSGCVTHPRNCGVCSNNKRCMLKRYRPTITT